MAALFKFLQGAAQIFIFLFDVATLRNQGCHDKKRINDTTHNSPKTCLKSPISSRRAEEKSHLGILHVAQKKNIP